MMKMFRLVILQLTLLVLSSAVFAGPAMVPDKDQYQDFLLAPWKPGAPTVVVFKDPYCGYCIKALQKLDRLANYNVFMFWAGILGDRSVTKVADIMQCAAPISAVVFNSVINRTQTVDCELGTNDQISHLNALNDQMVAAYKPNSVPAYYFGGRKVYVSQLDNFTERLKMNITPIQLQWSRYAALRVDNKAHQGLGNAILFLPADSIKRSYLLDALNKDSNYSWYLVEDSCNSGAQCNEKQKLAQELRLLLDLNEPDTNAMVINGTVINPERYAYYFSAGLATLLASH